MSDWNCKLHKSLFSYWFGYCCIKLSALNHYCILMYNSTNTKISVNWLASFCRRFSILWHITKIKYFALLWAALPQVWSPYLWWGRWIWNLHSRLSNLQKEDNNVSNPAQHSVNKMIFFLQVSGCFLFVCAEMKLRQWFTLQMLLLQLATCASPKCM